MSGQATGQAGPTMEPSDKVLDAHLGVPALRRQAAAAVRDLVRPSAYVAVAREAVLATVHVAAYPTGFLPRRVADSEANLAQRALLAARPETARMPVVLVHGWVHNRSAFLGLRRTLRRAGFCSVHAFDYQPLFGTIPGLAARLSERVTQILEETGAERCQLVAHSLGGLIARTYVQDLGGDATVDTVVTLGTPHRGTYTSYLATGPSVVDMRPGSAYLRRLEETARPSAVRWVSFWSDLDLLVAPAVSAKLVSPALQATNVRLHDVGHTSLLLSRGTLRTLAGWLADTDRGRPAHDWAEAGLDQARTRGA